MERHHLERLLFQMYDDALAEMPIENLMDLAFAERDAVMRFAVIEGTPQEGQ